MKKSKISEQLYYKLPKVYREEDAKIKGVKPLPLKRFLQVLGVGMDFMEQKIDGFTDIYNIDNCPKEFLDRIANTFGFKFPYALSETEQRRFVKVLPLIYKTKGTTKPFEYLAREIFGIQSTIKAYTKQCKEGTPLEDRQKIFIDITANGEQLNLGRKEQYFKSFAEIARPVNTKLLTLLRLYYVDIYDRLNKVQDSKEKDVISFKPYNEKYGHIFLVNGKEQPPRGSGLIMTCNESDANFILNESTLYKGQVIEYARGISESILPDNIIALPLLDTYAKEKLSDNQEKLELQDTFTESLSIVIRDTNSHDSIKFKCEEETYRGEIDDKSTTTIKRVRKPTYLGINSTLLNSTFYINDYEPSAEFLC